MFLTKISPPGGVRTKIIVFEFLEDQLLEELKRGTNFLTVATDVADRTVE